MNTASISDGLSQRMWIDGKSFKVVLIENVGRYSSRKTLVEDNSNNPQVFTYLQDYYIASRECRWSLLNDSGEVVYAGVSF